MTIWLWVAPLLALIFFGITALFTSDSPSDGLHILSCFTGFLAALSAIALLVGGILVGVAASGHATCQQEGNTAGVPYKYHLNSGCYLQIDKQWIPDSVWIKNTGN